MSEETVKVVQAAKIIGVKPSKLTELTHGGHIKYAIKTASGTFYYKISDLIEYMHKKSPDIVIKITGIKNSADIIKITLGLSSFLAAYGLTSEQITEAKNDDQESIVI